METSECALMEIMNDLLGDSSCYFTPPPCPGPVFLPPPPPGPGPVFLPPPPPGPGPVFLPPTGPGPVFLPPTGPGPVLFPPPVFDVGHGGWRNTELAPVLQQNTGPMAGLNRSQPAQLYNWASQWNGAPVSHFPSNNMSNMGPAGILNGPPVYPLGPGAPELRTIPKTKKRTRKKKDDDQPRLKKPLNAFMLYQNEQRRSMKVTDIVATSKVLGERWNNLSKDQKAKYFEQAQREAKLHDQQHHLKPPLFDHSPIEVPSIPHWSTSTHFDGQSFTFDNTDQLMYVFENELAEERLSVLDSAPEVLETPCLPDFTVAVMTAKTVAPAVQTPSPLVWSPSTEDELQDYSSHDVDQLISAFESELEAVIHCVPDSTVMSPRLSAQTSCISDWTAEKLGSPPFSPPKGPFDDGLYDDIDQIVSYH